MFKPPRIALLMLTLNLLGYAVAASSVGMLIARQRGAPARLVQTTHGISDLLKSARLKNDSEKAIASYRIGWGYVHRKGIEFHIGVPTNVPPGIKAGAIQNVPDQAVPFDAGADGVVFFVAEITFTDGSNWKASNSDIEHETLRQIACKGDC